MLNRPNRLRYDLTLRTPYVVHNNYWKRKPLQLIVVTGCLYMVPHVAIRTYHWLDKLSFWEDRIERRTIKKTAFDYMLKTQAEKERDLIEEFSDY